MSAPLLHYFGFGIAQSDRGIREHVRRLQVVERERQLSGRRQRLQVVAQLPELLAVVSQLRLCSLARLVVVEPIPTAHLYSFCAAIAWRFAPSQCPRATKKARAAPRQSWLLMALAAAPSSSS